MLLNEFNLMEGRGGHLYHATKADYAALILEANVIEDRTLQLLDAKRGKRIERATGETGLPIYGYEMTGGRKVKGVSLTRSYEFAMHWKGDVIFVLDHARLARDFRITPTDHVHGADWDYYSPGSVNMRDEWYQQYEEFLHGPLKNLNRYLVSVNAVNPPPVIAKHPLLNKVYPRNYASAYGGSRASV